MRNNFDDSVRECCKDSLLKGHLYELSPRNNSWDTPISTGEFRPFIQKETVKEVTSENTLQETSVPKHLYRYRASKTWLLRGLR